MMSAISSKPRLLTLQSIALATSLIVFTAGIVAGSPAIGQPMPGQDTTPPPSPGDNIRYGYVIHQSIDLGGHIVDKSGSGPMYATLVNIQSGPRILDSTFEMIAVSPGHGVFDRLSSSSFGYGGDPYDATFLNMSKGRIYDFRGSFRRNRQYFDYDLLANPLIPPESQPFVPRLNSPHLYNTVRRMTDVNLTVAPLSRIRARFGYFQNVNQGPSLSTIHPVDVLILQNWRVSTDVWNAGADWKPLEGTTISFDEFITHYKGNTDWQLTELNYNLANGTPVSLGVELSSVWRTPCAAPFNPNGTVINTCNSYTAYTRSSPTRTLLPSEQFRFQSTSVPHVTMNGRVMYMGTTSHLDHYNENFKGYNGGIVQQVSTATASARRINVNADYGITWQVTPKLAFSDVFDFWYFRQPAAITFTQTTYRATSIIAPPGPPTTVVTTSPPFAGAPEAGFTEVNQKTKNNTFLAIWDLASHARVSAGYRYTSRIITDAGGDFIPIHANWALFGLVLHPVPQLRLNFNADAMSADNSFTRMSPRKLQHYRMRTAYTPRTWLRLNGSINILTDSDNVQTVEHSGHSQDFSFSASINPSEKWGIDLSYAYDNIYSRTNFCYASASPVEGAQPSPPICTQSSLPYQSNGLYNQPTNSGSIGLVFHPIKRLHATAGYRMSSVDGTAPPINVRQVPGSLQSQYQTPYGGISYDIAPNWTWKGDYNYYGYGEGAPNAPTLPRPFHANIVTLAVRYAF